MAVKGNSRHSWHKAKPDTAKKGDDWKPGHDVENGSPPSTIETNFRRKADPFGDESKSEVKYKTMKWWQAGIIMIAETVSLGILSLPSVLAAIGFVPGIMLITGLGVLATYTGYVLGQFKLRYPHVHNMADAGEVMAGPIGREIFGAAQILFLVFAMGSHILTFSIMMNTVSDHGTCSIVFGFVGMILSLICTLPRTLHKVSYMSIASFISIIGAVMITMIGVAVPRSGTFHIQMTVESNFSKAFLATTNIVFAYAGHVAFFSFISELKYPEQYPKALYLLQAYDISMYLVVAVVIYYYTGSNVASPALGSTSPLLRKIAYGIAAPTILISGVINGHVAAKYIYVRLFRGTDRMGKRSWSSTSIWSLIVMVLWTLAWIIAEAIPVFNNLLALISALFASWFTYGLSGVFWLYMNRDKYFTTKRKAMLTVLNFTIFCLGAVICGLGLYASGKAINEDSKSSATSFTCSDNSHKSL